MLNVYKYCKIRTQYLHVHVSVHRVSHKARILSLSHVYICIFNFSYINSVGLPRWHGGTENRDMGLIPGLGRSPRVGNGNLLQYTCLENSMDRGAGCATDNGDTHTQKKKTDTTEQLSTHAHKFSYLLYILFSVSSIFWVKYVKSVTKIFCFNFGSCISAFASVSFIFCGFHADY